MGRLLSCPILAVQGIWTLSSVFAKYVKQKQDDSFISTTASIHNKVVNSTGIETNKPFHHLAHPCRPDPVCQ